MIFTFSTIERSSVLDVVRSHENYFNSSHCIKLNIYYFKYFIISTFILFFHSFINLYVGILILHICLCSPYQKIILPYQNFILFNVSLFLIPHYNKGGTKIMNLIHIMLTKWKVTCENHVLKNLYRNELLENITIYVVIMTG